VFSLRAFLELIRPGNTATALADVLAGFAVAGLVDTRALPFLLVATTCLYAGGITLNDVFDRHIDARERPERAIPSGRVQAGHAGLFGASLVTVGVAAAAMVSREAGLVAVAIAASVLLYDAWGKHRMFVGPVNMGLCRGLNLLLGMTAAPGVVAGQWPLALISLTYIAAVTALSRGEVSGGKRPVAVVAFILLLVVLGALKFVVLAPHVSGTGGLGAVSIDVDPFALALLAWLAWRILPPFWRTIGNPDPMVIRAAVRTGVLSLVLVDAVLAAAYAGMIYTLAVLSIWVVAGWLGRRFAVT